MSVASSPRWLRPTYSTFGSPMIWTRLRQPRRVHVVEAPVPFLQEVGADELAEPRAVAAVPGGLDLLEQRGGVGLDRVGGERGVVLGGLGGRGRDAAVALGHAPASFRSGAVASGPEAAGVRGASRDHQVDEERGDQEQGAEAVAEDRDAEQELDQDEDAEPAAAATATATFAAAASAEARGAAAGGGERVRGDDERDRHPDYQRDREPPPRHVATSASGPTPGSCWGTCWSAW